MKTSAVAKNATADYILTTSILVCAKFAQTKKHNYFCVDYLRN